MKQGIERLGRNFTPETAHRMCMRDMYEYHDLQRQSVNRSVYEHHIAETTNRIKSKAPEVTDVLEAA